MISRISTIFLAVIVLSNSIVAQSSYIVGIEKWRSAHQTELLADGGWLTVAGLFWLKEGVNTVGAGNAYDVQLTDNFKQGKFGEIVFSGGKATLTAAPGVEAKSDGKSITTVDLTSDEKTNKIEIGSQTFYMIKREDRFGIRLKDAKNPARTNFTGLKWFPIDPKLKVIAELEPYSEPQDVKVPNVLGGTFPYKSPGILKFNLGGTEYRLQPVIEGDHLFIIFRDLTSKTSTYGAGRFLYADAPKDGKVVLDFNKAENPPCAFTAFATCPLPPQQNRLDVEIKAGEKRYHK
jgi:uncharacterized protein (DUF1684 family)